MAKRVVFHQIPHGSGAQGNLGVERLFMGTDHENGQGGKFGLQIADQFQSAAVLERKIRNDQIGIQPSDGVEGVAGLFFFTTNNKVAFPAEELRDAVSHDGMVIAEIASSVHSKLHELGESRLFHKRIKEWSVAYSHRGTGSTRDRARDIDGIYDAGAPIPGEIADPNASALVAEVKAVVKDAAELAGGRLE